MLCIWFVCLPYHWFCCSCHHSFWEWFGRWSHFRYQRSLCLTLNLLYRIVLVILLVVVLVLWEVILMLLWKGQWQCWGQMPLSSTRYLSWLFIMTRWGHSSERHSFSISVGIKIESIPPGLKELWKTRALFLYLRTSQEIIFLSL